VAKRKQIFNEIVVAPRYLEKTDNEHESKQMALSQHQAVFRGIPNKPLVIEPCQARRYRWAK